MQKKVADINQLGGQVAKLIAEDFNGHRLLTEVQGGLFNKVYLWHDKEGEAFYIKQYKEASVSKVFSPPIINPSKRCLLAFLVHCLFNESNSDLPVCTQVYHYPLENILLVKGVNNPTPYIDYLSAGTVLWPQLETLCISLGRMHANGMEPKYMENPDFANTLFRDYKLQLQYYDLADLLGKEPWSTPELKTAIIQLADSYKTQRFTVLHGDLNSRNIILNKEDKTFGVIDFEQAHIGNPLYDLAYILSEVYICCLYYGEKTNLVGETLLPAYKKANPAFDLCNRMSEFKRHLGVQILYRLFGPSKNSWTFYVSNATQRALIIQFALQLITDDHASVI